MAIGWRGRGMLGEGQRGSATVEFALVLPLLLMVLLAVAQVGLLLRDRLVLADVARQAVRQAAVGVPDGQVSSEATSGTLTPVALTITRDPVPGGSVTVTARYVTETTLPLVGWLIPDVALDSSAVMRQESGDPVA